MKTKIIVIILFFFTCFTQANVFDRPSRVIPELATGHYSWLNTHKSYTLIVEGNKTAFSLMSEKAISDYFKLRMRNFVSAVKVKDLTEDSVYDSHYITIHVDLYDYNTTTNTYYGLMALNISPYTKDPSESLKEYEIFVPVAGHQSQIVGEIKVLIDQLVEVFASDYFYIEDLLSE